MHQIEIDFEVWKALTALRASERHSYNDVLRSILNLESVQEPESPLVAAFDVKPNAFLTARKGFYSRGLFLPDGTDLRAVYKGESYMGQIVEGQWIDPSGNVFSSPSAAASAITGNNVNGLRFWEGRRPTDANWCRLDLLS